MVTCSMQTAGEISLMTMMMINLTDVINFQLLAIFSQEHLGGKALFKMTQ